MILILSYFPAAVMGLPLAAFLGAFLTTLAIMAIANRVDSSKATVILAGIAVQAVLSAGISFFSLLDTDVLVSYNYFLWAACPTPALICYAARHDYFSRTRSVLSVFRQDPALVPGRQHGPLAGGKSQAGADALSGVRQRFRCRSGQLRGPAGVRGPDGASYFPQAGGNQTAPLLAVSAAVGSILVLTADLVGRTAFAPSEVPVGIVMSLIGAPFFFILLMRRRSARPC